MQLPILGVKYLWKGVNSRWCQWQVRTYWVLMFRRKFPDRDIFTRALPLFMLRWCFGYLRRPYTIAGSALFAIKDYSWFVMNLCLCLCNLLFFFHIYVCVTFCVSLVLNTAVDLFITSVTYCSLFFIWRLTTNLLWTYAYVCVTFYSSSIFMSV